MKLLVVGRSGQLARCLLHASRQHSDIEIVALGRPDIDLERPGSGAAAIDRVRPDAIVNAAAYTAVDQAEEEPERAHWINADAAGELAWAATRNGSRLIQLSTDYVFNGRSDRPYRPDDLPTPLNVYGRSKLDGERQVLDIAADHLVLRTAWLFSPFGRNFVRTMTELAEHEKIVRVVADRCGSPTPAKEVADAIFAVVVRWRSDPNCGVGQIYHVAGAEPASWADLAEAVFGECLALGSPGALVERTTAAERPSRANRPRRSDLDSSAFLQDFDRSPIDWRRGVRETVAGLVQARSSASTPAPG